MDADTFTPRLRISRHSPLVSTSDAGPSRFPNFSQILDVDMKDMPLSDDQFSNAPKNSTTPAATRSDNPAAVLRALLSRLPAHSPSPTQSLSAQDGTERESDFDTISESNAAPSIAQESLKHVFLKALRDPGSTPQKARRRRNSIDTSEVEASPRVEKERATNIGKRRSMSDDEVENISQSINRRDIRLKPTSQSITMEFLRERFSDSHTPKTSIEPPRSPPTSSNHDSSNDTATILRNLNSSQATPPAATSTPQQSLRLSTSSRFQFHSNLLDPDSEMQKAMGSLDSFDEGVTNGQASVSRDSKTLQTSPVLRHHSSSIKQKPRPSNSQKLTRGQSHSIDDLRTPLQRRERFHADPSRSPSPAPQLISHHSETNVISESRTKPSKDRSSISHSERHLRSEVRSTSRLSPLPHTELYRHHSPSSSSRTNSPAGSLRNHDDDCVDAAYERRRNWNSPRPIWHNPPPSPKLPNSRGASPSFSQSISPPTTNGHIRTNGFRTPKRLHEHHHDHHSHTEASRTSNPTTTEKEQPSRSLSPLSNEQSSPTPSRTSSLQAIDSAYRINEPNFRHASRSPSPPLPLFKELNGLPATRLKTPLSFRKQGTKPLPMNQEEEDHSLLSREKHLSRRSSASQLTRTTELATPRNEDTVRDRAMDSDGLRETDFSSHGETPRLRVLTLPPDISEDGHSRSGIPPGNDDLPQGRGIDSTPDHTAQTDVTTFPLTPVRNRASRSLSNEFKTPGFAHAPAQSTSVDSSDTTERNGGLLTPVASFSKSSKLEPRTPAIPGAWLATPAVKKSTLKVRFEPEVSTLTDKSMDAKHPDASFHSSTSAGNGLDVGDDGLQRMEQLSLKSPPSPRRQKSLKSPKIRVLDAFGREQEPDVSNQEHDNGSPSPLRVVDGFDEGDLVEGTEATSYSASSRRELLSRIQNGLDDLVAGIDNFDQDNQALTIDHDKVQQLTTISKQARGLREKLYSRVDNSRFLFSGTKATWFPTNPKAYIFLIFLQLSLVWLMYRICFNKARELWLNTYYDPFNPELHLYIFNSDASLHVLRSEGARPTSWSSLIGHIWDTWIHFMGSMLRFWQVWDKGAVLQYDNTWTPT